MLFSSHGNSLERLSLVQSTRFPCLPTSQSSGIFDVMLAARPSHELQRSLVVLACLLSNL